MVLSGLEIANRIGSDIIIEPYNVKKINPNSYNLTLNNKLLVYSSTILDMKENNPTTEIIIPEDGLIIYPGRLYLGRTNEYTKTENLLPMLEGRSSVGRLGMAIHITAGFGDNGFAGYWTLEISCIHPVKIYPNIDICQIYYHTIEGDTSLKYHNGKYYGNNGIQASMMYKDFENMTFVESVANDIAKSFIKNKLVPLEELIIGERYEIHYKNLSCSHNTAILKLKNIDNYPRRYIFTDSSKYKLTIIESDIIQIYQ
jgi:dCTP deaminase